MSGNQRAAPCAGACIKPVIRDGAAADIKTTSPTGILHWHGQSINVRENLKMKELGILYSGG